MKSRKLRKSWVIVGWMLVGLVIYLSLIPMAPIGPAIPGIDKLFHFIAYLVLTLWFAQLYSKRPVFLVFLFGFLGLGAGLEIAQSFIPQRYPEWLDFFSNGGGVLIGGFLGKTRLGNIFAKELKE